MIKHYENLIIRIILSIIEQYSDNIDKGCFRYHSHFIFIIKQVYRVFIIKYEEQGSKVTFYFVLYYSYGILPYIY